MNDFDGAMQCYEQALKFNQWSVPAMVGIACILRTKDAFPSAVEYLRTILKVDPANGDVWGSLGRCWNVALFETINQPSQATATWWWTICSRLTPPISKRYTICPTQR
jgi:tetratricopeptide (TPR) repeat protein